MKIYRAEKKVHSSIKNNVAYMLKEAWQIRKSVIFYCAALVMLSVCIHLTELFIVPIILRQIEQRDTLMQLISVICLFSLLLLIFKSLYAYLSSNTLFGRLEVRLSFIFQIHRKVATTSYPNTEEISAQKKLQQANMAVAGNGQATEKIWETLTNLCVSMIGFLVYLLILTTVDSRIILFITVLTLLSFRISRHAANWSYTHREEEASCMQTINYVNRKAEDTILAKDIQMFGMRPWLEDIYQDAFHLYEDFTQRKESKILLAELLNILLTFFRNGIVYYYLISGFFDGRYSISLFLLYFSTVNGFTGWITNILSGFTTLHKECQDIAKMREYLNLSEPFQLTLGSTPPCDASAVYEISLKNVSFSYPGSNKKILHNLNLTIHGGEKLAVVGLNGAGKTTLIKLICGFYDPTQGEVLLNGHDIKEYNRLKYYALFSAVFQQFSILETSILENVTQSHGEINREKALACLERAGLHNKVSSLTNKEDTHIGRIVYDDGISLSGGELQSLMLARALYKDAPILVLDEPTAALDPIAENSIYQKYNDMTAQKTSIYISHRLASTRFCDRIIFLAHGAIEEEGTHQSLIDAGGSYAKLFQIQSKYYLKEEL